MTDAYKPQAGTLTKSTPGVQELADQAKNIGKDLKAQATDLTNTVTRSVQDQVAELGKTAKSMAADATDRAGSAMNEQKNASANYLGRVAQVVERAAGEFDNEMPYAAQYIRQAASQIDTVATAVRQRDIRELVGEVQELARRQPTLFFGGAVVLGFAALRFLKSSAPSSTAVPGGRDISQPRSF
jgi:polyhydroxyalkanoate synthesis regulator phasin